MRLPAWLRADRGQRRGGEIVFTLTVDTSVFEEALRAAVRSLSGPPSRLRALEEANARLVHARTLDITRAEARQVVRHGLAAAFPDLQLPPEVRA